MSGCGVFNNDGKLIGVLVGRSAKAGTGVAFVNLGRVADAETGSGRFTRLTRWLDQGAAPLHGGIDKDILDQETTFVYK